MFIWYVFLSFYLYSTYYIWREFFFGRQHIVGLCVFKNIHSDCLWLVCLQHLHSMHLLICWDLNLPFSYLFSVSFLCSFVSLFSLSCLLLCYLNIFSIHFGFMYCDFYYVSLIIFVMFTLEITTCILTFSLHWELIFFYLKWMYKSYHHLVPFLVSQFMLYLSYMFYLIAQKPHQTVLCFPFFPAIKHIFENSRGVSFYYL